MQNPNNDPPSDSSDDYYLEIESRFAQLRKTHFVFSARDWGLMKGWREEGVPLAIVLEAIDQCFTRREERKKRGTISSLAYCRHAVEELWEERKQLYVGGEGATEEQAPPAELLRALADELRRSAIEARPELGDRITACAAEIEGLAEGRTVSDIENELMEIEQRLLEDLTARLDQAERDAIAGEVSEALATVKGGDAAVLEKSRSAVTKRLLRRRLAIPRLSLFS